MVGQRLSFKNSGIDLDCKIWTSAHFCRVAIAIRSSLWNPLLDDKRRQSFSHLQECTKLFKEMFWLQWMDCWLWSFIY